MKIIDLLNKIANEEIEYTRLFDAQVGMGHTNINEYFERYPINANYLNCEIVEILPKKEEEKKIPEKLKWNEKSQHNIVTDNTKKTLEHLLSRSEQLKKSINQIVDYLDYLKSKGE